MNFPSRDPGRMQLSDGCYVARRMEIHSDGMRPSRDKSGSTIRDFDLWPRHQCNDGYDKSGSHHPRFCWSISPFQRFSLVCYYLVTAAGAHSALPSMHDILTNLSIFSSVARSVYLVMMSAGFSVPRTLWRVTAPVRTFSWHQRSVTSK